MVKELTLALLIALAGCSTARGSFCAVSSPIRLSAAAVAALSDAEVRALLAHNRKGAALCGWSP
ncbi:MAG: hypothetical protein E5X33_30585 [Mesorhizobium sp.]|uniref:hypothetical protein n=1 Tax=Mesorhizobium sp. TaxID=1871066 RepID=UPI000FE67A86|nr:hypothetical protein [Mesorhizobium sp.]RWI94673.1 MAG: hypothetical protein EOR22_11495 [Mesorhizobium sp.]TIR15884.1 MAG: hypothetical protein E5X33_30585 [Mesorhizobium sp.]